MPREGWRGPLPAHPASFGNVNAGKLRRVSLAFWRAKLHKPQLTAAPRGPLADAVQGTEQPPGCPRDQPRSGSTPESGSPAPPHINTREEGAAPAQPWASSPRRSTPMMPTSPPRRRCGTVAASPSRPRPVRSASSGIGTGAIYLTVLRSFLPPRSTRSCSRSALPPHLRYETSCRSDKRLQ